MEHRQSDGTRGVERRREINALMGQRVSVTTCHCVHGRCSWTVLAAHLTRFVMAPMGLRAILGGSGTCELLTLRIEKNADAGL